MNDARHQKVTTSHLARDAYLYVRQAVLRGTFANAECVQRQYNLRGQAVALGWPAERVIVIDNDLGRSGSGTTDRPGFERLLRQIRLGRIGIVMALEPSRLARDFGDWHRLLDACAASDTLVLDQDGLYDLGDLSDRVLLGYNATMPRTVAFSQQEKEALL